MKIELEQKDMQAIAQEVAEMIKPLLAGCNGKGKDDDVVFDVSGLAEYLKVDKSWVYKQVSLKTIPFFKAGKFTRFRRPDIDKWVDKKTVKPIPLLSSHLRLVNSRR